MSTQTITDDSISGSLAALITHLNVSSNRDLLGAIADEQLTFSELLLLDRLRGGHRRPTVKQAAILMNVTQGAASRIVDRLAKRGLVRRDSDDRDFRTRRITITARGDSTLTRLHRCRVDHIEQFTDALTPTERDALGDALEQLLRREPIAACRPQTQ